MAKRVVVEAMGRDDDSVAFEKAICFVANSYSLGCMLTVLCLVTFFQFWREVSSGKVILPKHSNPKKPVKIMARKRQLSWRVEV